MGAFKYLNTPPNTMSELKDFYVGKMGHKYDMIENTSWYLSELALRGAIEVDNHTLGKNDDFSHVLEMAEILERYQLKDTGSIPFDFPYDAILRVVRTSSDKEIRLNSELALEMRLLKSELSDILEKPEAARELLCELSNEFLSGRQALRRYVA